MDDTELTAAFEEGLAEAGYAGAQRRIADIYAALYNEQVRILRAQTVGGKYFEAGDYERAIEWFEKALENHEGNLPYITRPHYYEILRSYPRYLNILRRMGMPVEWCVAMPEAYREAIIICQHDGFGDFLEDMGDELAMLKGEELIL